MVNKSFSYQTAEKLVSVFSKYSVEYLIIGKSGAVLYGFPDTTQDIDIFPKRDSHNGTKIVSALEELGFEIDPTLKNAIIDGRDFIQIRGGAFDIDLIFAPDGIESFEEAKRKSNVIDGRYPVASLRDIINSKKASGRKRDKEVLERLEDFYRFLRETSR